MDVSRSEQKRRLKRLEELVKELAGLPASIISQIPCSDAIRALFHEASMMKGGARKRQIKYITKLFKEEPVEEIYAFLTKRKGAALKQKKEFHELELYRDTLLTEAIEWYRNAEENREEPEEDWPSLVIGEISSELPGVDRKALVRLASYYARTRNRKYSRELFRLLRAAYEQKKRDTLNEKIEKKR
ncbi:MAG: DarP family protein [Desulfobulbales bacterium]